MATLHVRNVPDELYARLRLRAEANGRSIGAEAVHLLDDGIEGSGPRSPIRGIRRRRRLAGARPVPFAPSARRVLESAQAEARGLGHAHIDTEHLLLGILNFRPLPGVTLEQARNDVAARVGRGNGAPDGQIPFTPAAKKSLELAIREAHPDPARPEHIALGLLRAKEGIGNDLLRIGEPDVKRLRRCLHDALDAASIDEPGPFRVIQLDGTPEEWERQLNTAAADGYELVSLVGDRAVMAHPPTTRTASARPASRS
jgi:plasmid stability protein